MADSQNIQSIQRAMQILYLVAGVEDGLSIAQLASRTGLKPNTVYKFTRTLENEKLLVRLRSPLRFVLGSAINELATLNHEKQLLTIASRELIRAQGQLLEGSFILLEREDTITYKRMFTDGHRPGFVIKCRDIPVAPYSKASTLLLLAYADPDLQERYMNAHPFEKLGMPYWDSRYKLECYLREIKRKGYCIPSFENENGSLYSIAAPIFTQGKAVYSAVGSCISLTESKESQRRLVKLTLDAADSISKQIQEIAGGDGVA